MTRFFITVTCLCAFAMALSACGRRGGLEAPPGAASNTAEVTTQQQTGDPFIQQPGNTDPGTVAESENLDGSTVSSGVDTGLDSRAEKPKRPFFLDPLL